MKVSCLVCKTEKNISPYRVKSFKYCSTACKYQAMKEKKPWNYGKKYTDEQKVRMNTLGLEIGRQKRYHQCTSRAYGAIHYWVRKNKGKAETCENCGFTGGQRGCTWANKDHKYRKNTDDYISLCNKCHFEYDVNLGLRDATINPKARK